MLKKFDFNLNYNLFDSIKNNRSNIKIFIEVPILSFKY